MTTATGTMGSSGSGFGVILILLLVGACVGIFIFGVPMAMADLGTTTVAEAETVTNATVGTLEDLQGLLPPGLKNPEEALQQGLNDLNGQGSASHAALRHAAVFECMLHIVNNLPHNQVYASLNAPEKNVNYPSLAFVWHLDKAIRDLNTPGPCGAVDNVQRMLSQEFGIGIDEVGDIRNFKIVLYVGIDISSGRIFSISMMPVRGEFLNMRLCEWGYYWMIIPKFKPTNCFGNPYGN